MKNLVEKLEEILEIGTIENVTDQFRNRKPNYYSPMDTELWLMVENGETIYEFSPNTHPSEYECQISNSGIYDFINRTWMYIQEVKIKQQKNG